MAARLQKTLPATVLKSKKLHPDVERVAHLRGIGTCTAKSPRRNSTVLNLALTAELGFKPRRAAGNNHCRKATHKDDGLRRRKPSPSSSSHGWSQSSSRSELAALFDMPEHWPTLSRNCESAQSKGECQAILGSDGMPKCSYNYAERTCSDIPLEHKGKDPGAIQRADIARELASIRNLRFPPRR